MDVPTLMGTTVYVNESAQLKIFYLIGSYRMSFFGLNPPFRNAMPFLNNYFTERDKTPYNTGACILLPAWRCFTEHLVLSSPHKIVHYPKGARLLANHQRMDNPVLQYWVYHGR